MQGSTTEDDIVAENFERIRINRGEAGKSRDGASQDAAKPKHDPAGQKMSREGNQQARPPRAADPNAQKSLPALELHDKGKPVTPAKARQAQASGKAAPPAPAANAKFDRNNVHRDFKGRGQPASSANQYRVRGDQVQPQRVNCTRPKAPDPNQVRSLRQVQQQNPAQNRPPQNRGR